MLTKNTILFPFATNAISRLLWLQRTVFPSKFSTRQTTVTFEFSITRLKLRSGKISSVVAKTTKSNYHSIYRRIPQSKQCCIVSQCKEELFTMLSTELTAEKGNQLFIIYFSVRI